MCRGGPASGRPGDETQLGTGQAHGKFRQSTEAVRSAQTVGVSVAGRRVDVTGPLPTGPGHDQQGAGAQANRRGRHITGHGQTTTQRPHPKSDRRLALKTASRRPHGERDRSRPPPCVAGRPADRRTTAVSAQPSFDRSSVDGRLTTVPGQPRGESSLPCALSPAAVTSVWQRSPASAGTSSARAWRRVRWSASSRPARRRSIGRVGRPRRCADRRRLRAPRRRGR
jgi:hypothetical protein